MCFFQFYSGSSTQAPMLAKVCGFEIPTTPIQTVGNQLFIIMNTDRYGGNGQGFLLEWEAIAPLGKDDPQFLSTASESSTKQRLSVKNDPVVLCSAVPTLTGLLVKLELHERYSTGNIAGCGNIAETVNIASDHFHGAIFGTFSRLYPLTVMAGPA